MVHFSGYSPLKPNVITKRWKNCYFDLFNSDLEIIYDEYRQNLLKNNYAEFSKINCFYLKNSKIELLIRFFKKMLLKAIYSLDSITEKYRALINKK